MEADLLVCNSKQHFCTILIVAVLLHLQFTTQTGFSHEINEVFSTSFSQRRDYFQLVFSDITSGMTLLVVQRVLASFFLILLKAFSIL